MYTKENISRENISREDIKQALHENGYLMNPDYKDGQDLVKMYYENLRSGLVSLDEICTYLNRKKRIEKQMTLGEIKQYFKGMRFAVKNFSGVEMEDALMRIEEMGIGAVLFEDKRDFEEFSRTK